MPGSTVTSSVRPFCLAWGRSRSATLRSSAAGSIGSGFSSSFAGLDLREVDDVVEQLRQHGAAAQRLVQQLAAVIRQLVALEQVHHAQHPVHRRADLVAHIGQELGLGVGGAQRRVAGGDQLGDILADADHIPRLGAGPAHAAPGGPHPDPGLAGGIQIAVGLDVVVASGQGSAEGLPDGLALLGVGRGGHFLDRHRPHPALGRGRGRDVLLEGVDPLARVEPPDIDTRRVAQQLIGALGLLAFDPSGAILGEVLEDDQQGLDPQRLGQHLGARADPQPTAALAGQAVFGQRLALGPQGGAQGDDRVGVVQVEEVLDRSAQGLLGRPSGQGGPGGIDADDGVVLQHHEHVEAALEEPVGGGLLDAEPGRLLGQFASGSLAQVLAHPRSLVFNRYAHERVKVGFRRTASSIAPIKIPPPPRDRSGGRPQEGYRLEHA
jgi:hypothetical protein